MIKIRFALPFVAALLGIGAAHAEVLGEHGDWVATKGSEAGKPLCYISAEPQKAEGKYTKRGQIYAIVTHRPAEQSIAVVSFQAGYAYADGAEVTVSIDGKTTFSLFTQGEFAWTRQAADDGALVKAMRAGSVMVVKGSSARGTLTTDTYSLSGFSAALNTINAACGVKK